MKRVHVRDEEEQPRIHIQEKADMLGAHSTAPGYVSYRSPSGRSIFIQELVNVNEKAVHKDHVAGPLTKVQSNVNGNR